MKLLSINLAKSVWLGTINDFNPKGRALISTIVPFLVDLYKFKKIPSEKELNEPDKGIIFDNGEFINKDGDLIAIRLSLFNDGLVADTRSSTVDSDAFLDDLFTQLSAQYNLPNYHLIIKKKIYASQVFVTTEKSLEIINPTLIEISKYLSEKIVGFGEVNFELGGIHFWPDQASPTRPSVFIFERTLNVPFSDKRYYSAAPLQTEEHLELLNILEQILSK
jgi:hypothetical protein